MAFKRDSVGLPSGHSAPARLNDIAEQCSSTHPALPSCPQAPHLWVEQVGGAVRGQLARHNNEHLVHAVALADQLNLHGEVSRMRCLDFLGQSCPADQQKLSCRHHLYRDNLVSTPAGCRLHTQSTDASRLTLGR